MITFVAILALLVVGTIANILLSMVGIHSQIVQGAATIAICIAAVFLFGTVVTLAAQIIMVWTGIGMILSLFYKAPLAA